MTRIVAPEARVMLEHMLNSATQFQVVDEDRDTWSAGNISNMHWQQERIRLSAQPRGFHLVTREIVQQLPVLDDFEVGLLHLFIQHTSAGLTLNENADPDVRVDMETAINHICPENLNYIHTCEGPDDMPAHVKSSLMGSSLSIPISGGRLALGTWQGIYLCEHRNHASGRHLVATIMGSRVTTTQE